MASMTSYLAKKLGDHSLGKTSFTMPTTVYMALLTSNPTKAGTQTAEVSGGSYARQAITAAMGATDSVTGISTNTTEVVFPAPTANWGTVSHIAVLDALTTGNMLYFELLPSSAPMAIGSLPLRFPVGSIRLTMLPGVG